MKLDKVALTTISKLLKKSGAGSSLKTEVKGPCQGKENVCLSTPKNRAQLV